MPALNARANATLRLLRVSPNMMCPFRFSGEKGRGIVDESPLLQLRGIMRRNVPDVTVQDVTNLCSQVAGLQFAGILFSYFMAYK
jgi:hypothetical protein